MPHLFDPFPLKSVTLRNRVGVSPMCMYSYQDGFSNDWHIAHLGARAAGGAGLVIAEATAVEARGRISPCDLGIWSDEHVAGLARVAGVIKANGAVPGIQIAHAGRKASTNQPWETPRNLPPEHPLGWQGVAPSPIAYDENYTLPVELDLAGIKQIQGAFREGARRALAAGFEWLEIHAAHGYLIHSFYSPLSNQRRDVYGGPFENRVRFLLETVATVQEVWPQDYPLTVRISGTDWTAGGWTVPDSVELGKLLKQAGVDLVDCSSGGNVSGAKYGKSPGYQAHIAEAVRAGADIPTAAVGLITEAVQADEIIRTGRADMVLLGRAMLRDPHWATHAALALGKEAPVPRQYLKAY